MTFLQLPTLRVRFLVYKSTHPGADQSNLIIQQIKKCLNKFYNGSVRSTVEFIVAWTKGCAFRITSRFFFSIDVDQFLGSIKATLGSLLERYTGAEITDKLGSSILATVFRQLVIQSYLMILNHLPAQL